MKPRARSPKTQAAEGWHGWDEYAAFYDWENARTLGRRDVGFWRESAKRAKGEVLELGCGTGRLLAPIARAGVQATGVDRSQPMLELARRRLSRLPRRRRPRLVRADIRSLPFRDARFALVVAGYGILQSLIREDDLAAALREVARVLVPGGRLGIDLVPDLPRWREYERKVSLEGRGSGGRRIQLIETVRQDRRRGLTIFDEEFVVSRPFGRRRERHRFSLTFRTVGLPALEQTVARFGLAFEGRFGDYDRGPWTEASDTWLVVARKVR